MRVVTWNLQHGRPAVGADGGAPVRVLEDAARELAAVGPDLLLLQEVDRHQARSGRLDQAADLARELGLPHVRFAASFTGPAGGLHRPPPRGGMPRSGYGVALLSRYPVAASQVHRLGRSWPRVHRARGAWSVRVDGARVCLTATVSTPEGPLSVAVTHLSTDAAAARQQLRRCEQVLAALPGPHLLGGDLNLEPAAVAAGTALRPVAHGPTFTNARPRRQLDHLLVGTGVHALTEGTVHHLSVSDHAALSVEVGLTPEGGHHRPRAPRPAP